MIAPDGYLPLSYLVNKATKERESEIKGYLRYLYRNEINFLNTRPMDVLSKWVLEFSAGKKR